MEQPKYSMNAFLITITIFSAILFFITITISKLSDRSVLNLSYPIEDTGYYIRYATHIRSGIYDSNEVICNMMIEGSYGYDWGAAAEGDVLYCNEYHTTTYGLMTCDLVKISLKDFHKDLLMKDTMLRGRCASGELICFEGVVMADWFPDTNPLADLYGFADGQRFESSAATVHVIDPGDGRDLYSVFDEGALSDERAEFYLNASAKEIME